MSIRRIIRRSLTVAVASQALVACMPGPSQRSEDPDFAVPPPVQGRLSVDVSMRSMPSAAAPEAMVAMTAAAAIDIDNCTGCTAQIAMALGDSVACVYDGEAGEGRVDFELQAPDRSGRHAVRYAAVLNEGCAAAERAALSGAVLAHIEVAAAGPPDENRRPEVTRLDVTPADFASGCETLLQAEARDPDGDRLTLRWQVDGAPAGEGGELALPGGRARQTTVTVTARDPDGRAHSQTAQLDLPACEVPRGAVVSADGRSAFVQTGPGRSFDEARVAAAEAGGHLATIADGDQMAMLADAFGGGWIGYHSPNRDGQWTWITGELEGDGSFCRGEPNNAGGGEYAVELWDIACLNDENPGREKPAIVEFEMRGGADDVSAGGAFERAPIDEGGRARSRLYLDAPATVRVAVGDGRGGCDGVGDPMLTVRFGGDAIAAVDDANGSVCPEAVFEAPAGKLDVLVEGFSGRALPEHRLVVELDAEPVLPELMLSDGDGGCPNGFAPLSPELARHFSDEVCGLLGTWYIVRLADGAAMDGPGYGCNVRPVEREPLGQTLCARR